jgi:8-oxo-dGTP diphosphatase
VAKRKAQPSLDRSDVEQRLTFLRGARAPITFSVKGLMRIPEAAFGIVKEAARHLLRRPVCGFVVYATVPNGEVLLIRRGDTGRWALPGGTLEWGETLRQGVVRELQEEAGVEVLALGALLGVYSRPERDPRFHAVTTAVACSVSLPVAPPLNPLEILEVRTFAPHAIPLFLSHGLDEIVERARRGESHWE